MMKKCVCEECNWHGLEDDLLKAPNPFDSKVDIIGCPECKQVESLLYACDEDGCWNKVSKGLPTPDGYKVFCHKHGSEFL